MSQKPDDFQALADNPFYVLGLRPDCSRVDVEREGQKLLGMLGLKLKSAATYMSPLGPRPRTEDKVRAAMAALRDHEKRLAHEFWASLPPPAAPPKPPPAPETKGPGPAPFTEAFAALGWRRS
ncbi:hypothetical protein OV090_32075 [Nannocystis sp. RBIL2]|uniref:hypothetical protein n=1 Tax=Nannocystis sp. RBIL2 TaxID=2996788 RepID=UPI00226ED747|nr:hypothetical protein [Nannocystis sp. RBIL2]MCY1069423.1 hypothetical protein [Nannocystis sp. RBIL2]